MDDVFTSAPTGSPTLYGVDAIRALQEKVKALGPAKCMVLMPDGAFYTGTLIEMCEFLERAAMREHPLYRNWMGDGILTEAPHAKEAT